MRVDSSAEVSRTMLEKHPVLSLSPEGQDIRLLKPIQTNNQL